MHLDGETLCYYCDDKSNNNTGGPYSSIECNLNADELNAGRDCKNDICRDYLVKIFDYEQKIKHQNDLIKTYGPRKSAFFDNRAEMSRNLKFDTFIHENFYGQTSSIVIEAVSNDFINDKERDILRLQTQISEVNFCKVDPTDDYFPNGYCIAISRFEQEIVNHQEDITTMHNITTALLQNPELLNTFKYEFWNVTLLEYEDKLKELDLLMRQIEGEWSSSNFLIREYEQEINRLKSFCRPSILASNDTGVANDSDLETRDRYSRYTRIAMKII